MPSTINFDRTTTKDKISNLDTIDLIESLKQPIGGQDDLGFHLACKALKKDAFIELMQRGDREEKIGDEIRKLLTKQGKDKWTPLHYAVFYQETDAVKELLDIIPDDKLNEAMNMQYGAADIGEKRTPLQLAAGHRGNHIGTSQETYHGDPEVQDAEGKVFKMLLEKATSETLETALQLKDEYGWTVLHEAARYQPKGNIKILCQKISNAKLVQALIDKNKNEKTPLDYLEGRPESLNITILSDNEQPAAHPASATSRQTDQEALSKEVDEIKAQDDLEDRQSQAEQHANDFTPTTHTDFASIQADMKTLIEQNNVLSRKDDVTSTEHRTVPAPTIPAQDTSPSSSSPSAAAVASLREDGNHLPDQDNKGLEAQWQEIEHRLIDGMEKESQHILEAVLTKQKQLEKTLRIQLQANNDAQNSQIRAVDEKMQDALISQQTHFTDQMASVTAYIAELERYLKQMDTPLSELFKSDKEREMWKKREDALTNWPEWRNWHKCYQTIRTSCFHLLLTLISVASGEFQQDKGIKGQLSSWLSKIHPILAAAIGFLDARDSQKTKNNTTSVANQFLYSPHLIDQLAAHFAYQVTISYRTQIAFLQDDQLPRFANIVYARLFNGLKNVRQDSFVYKNTSPSMDIEALAFRFRLLLLEADAPRLGTLTTSPEKTSMLLNFLNKFPDIPTFTHARLTTTDDNINQSDHPWTERVLDHAGFAWYPDPVKDPASVILLRSNKTLETKIEKYGYMVFTKALGCGTDLFRCLCEEYGLVADVPSWSDTPFKQLAEDIDQQAPLSDFMIQEDQATLGAQPEFHLPQQQLATPAMQEAKELAREVENLTAQLALEKNRNRELETQITQLEKQNQRLTHPEKTDAQAARSPLSQQSLINSASAAQPKPDPDNATSFFSCKCL